MFKISSTGPIECKFKTLTLVVFRPGAGSYFTQGPITIFGEKNLKETFCPIVQRDAKNWRFQRPAKISESFARVETKI